MNYHHIFRICLMAVCILTSMPVWAADGNNSAFFENYNVRDTLAKRGKTIYFDNPDLQSESKMDMTTFWPGSTATIEYLPNRRALTGESCNINKLINSVGVGSWNDNLGNLLNDDLDDYCSFNAVASVGVTVNPYVSVRDRSCYYAKGCQAGFCIVAGSGNSVLSLDVIKAMSIGFYRDGNLVGTVAIGEGQNAGGVNLSLIQIPGSDDANIYLTAEAPGVFDEISLDPAGGVNVSAGQILRIKYAFVGRAREFTVTYNEKNGMYSDDKNKSPYYKYLQAKGIEKDVTFKEKNITVYNAALLGLPFPAADKANFFDADLTNTTKITPILTVGYQGGAKFLLNYFDQRKDGDEIFEAGTEVGFKYDFATVLNLDLGTWMQIVLYDINGNKVHSEEVSAEVLGLSVAGGGAGNTSIIAPVAFSGAEIRFMTTVTVDLGGIGLYYAFIREKPDIRHHCPINPSPDVNLCPDQTSFQLRSNPNVSVTWTLESNKVSRYNEDKKVTEVSQWDGISVTPDGYVSGLPGTADMDEYTEYEFAFKATAADGCYDIVYIRKGFNTDLRTEGDQSSMLCGQPITNDSDEITDESLYQIKHEYSDHSTSGALIDLDKIHDIDNVVKKDLNLCAKYIGGLKIGSDVPIVGIEKKGDEPIHTFTDEEEGIRVGFVVSSAIEGINLSALQFYTIRLYDKEGKEIMQKVIDESNTVSADIGGSNTSQKLRFSIGVPAADYVGKEVYAFALWTSGVLDLEGGELDIFYGFVEDGLESECSDPLGCDPQVLSYKHTHTTLDFDMMQGGSAVVVANAVNDLDNMVDDDLNSFMSIANTVSLGNGLPIAVKIGKTVDYRNQLGIVMDNKTYVAGVNAGSWMTVETYYNGVATGDKFTDWNVADVNVIGFGDKNVILVQPKMMYDEVVITVAKTIGALDIIRFYGLFLRSDVDGDGIPDCQDPVSCVEGLDDNNLQIEEGCEGDVISLTIKNLDGGSYKLRFNDPSTFETETVEKTEPDSEEVKTIVVVKNTFDFEINSTAPYNKTYESTKAGIYQVMLLDSKETPLITKTYKVYPTETTWKTDASNADWNKWDNWTEGSPYCCTDVIITSDAKIYPDLSEEVDADNADLYCCDRIHFEPGAEIGNVTNLNYTKAWVDFILKANQYYNVSVPLQGVVTGDMFIPEDCKGVHIGEKFVELNADNTKENRFNPTIYQRLWDRTAEEYILSKKDYITPTDEDVVVATTQWSHYFNSVRYQYGLAEGFAMWVDNGNLPESQDFRFRLPKTHTEYNYYNDLDHSKEENTTQTITRVEKTIGRFISEPASAEKNRFEFNYDRKVADNEEKLKDQYPQQRTVYTGDFSVSVRTEAVGTDGNVIALFGNPLMSAISVKELMNENSDVKAVIFQDGTTVSTIMVASEDGEETVVNNNAPSTIKPLEAVYLRIASNAVSNNEYTLSINKAMISTSAATSEPAEQAPALSIAVSSESSRASLTVAYADVENVLMLDGEVAPEVAIFTVGADDKALDIVAADRDRLPLSIIKREQGPLTFSFITAAGFPRDEYELADLKTGIVYPIDSEVTISDCVGSSSGRFVLVRKAEESGVEEVNEASDVYLEVDGNEVTAHAASATITSIEVYDMKGAMTGMARSEGTDVLKVTAPSGISIVRVIADGKTSSHKIAIK